MTSEHFESLLADNREKPYQRQKGVALKRTLEEHAPCASGPEAKKMAGAQDPNVILNPNAVTEDWSVPDKMVGLIIGRDGKQITRLQQDSQCKVQLSSESNGTTDRPCKLTGSKQAVEKAKELIVALIARGQETSLKGSLNGPNIGDITVDVPCPASKAGLVIGRGGETIRGLQERAGVKMIVVQEVPGVSHMEKPIRITGEPSKVELAKNLVLELINTSPQNGSGYMGGGYMDRGGFSNPGGMGPTTLPNDQPPVQRQLVVPRQAVGVVIGKQGDTIKRIQQETGARVQFQTPQDENNPHRICHVSGHNSQVVDNARSQIEDLINSVLKRDDENGSLNGFVAGGMGRGTALRGTPGGGIRGRGGFRGGRGGARGGPMGGPPMGHMSSPPMNTSEQEVQMQVPGNKCGLVIGKGGESIRAIMAQSGAYVELSRSGPLSGSDKYFTIRGNLQQIETAQQMISDKIGLMGVSNGSSAAYQPGFGGQFQQPAQYGAVSQTAGQSAWGQPTPYQQTTNGTAQWGQPPTAATPNGDMSKSDGAAWATYYPAFYQAGGAQAACAAQPGAPTQSTGTSNPSAPASAGPGAQTDYSQAWIDYYRQLGMYQEAEMIELQVRAGRTQPSTSAQQQGGAPGGPSTVAQNGTPWGANAYGTPSPYGGAPSAAPYAYGYTA